MKTIASIFFALSLGFSTSIFASETNHKCQTTSAISDASAKGLQVNVYQLASGKVSVVLIQESAQPVQITIADDENNTMFKERVTETAARQNFDLSHLEKGNYTFTINSKGNCFVKTVEVK